MLKQPIIGQLLPKHRTDQTLKDLYQGNYDVFFGVNDEIAFAGQGKDKSNFRIISLSDMHVAVHGIQYYSDCWYKPWEYNLICKDSNGKEIFSLFQGFSKQTVTFNAHPIDFSHKYSFNFRDITKSDGFKIEISAFGKYYFYIWEEDWLLCVICFVFIKFLSETYTC